MSFLQRLKGRGVRNQDQGLLSDAEETDMNDVHVSIEGDADIVLIEGKRIRPEYIPFPRKKAPGAFVAEECVWGDFYRRIILPESVNIEKADAKIKNGVLILMLPLLKPSEKEKVTLKVSRSQKATTSKSAPSKRRATRKRSS